MQFLAAGMSRLGTPDFYNEKTDFGFNQETLFPVDIKICG
jgi:hypothetical protein